MMQNGDIISDQQAHIVPVSDEGDIQALIKPIRGVQVILDRDVAIVSSHTPLRKMASLC